MTRRHKVTEAVKKSGKQEVNRKSKAENIAVKTFEIKQEKQTHTITVDHLGRSRFLQDHLKR